MTDYPELRAELQKLSGKLGKELAGPMSAFATLHKNALADGALSKKEKELIALGIGIASRCEPCIYAHVEKCLKNGATPAEVMEAAGVAVMMGGGPVYTYTPVVAAAIKHFESPVAAGQSA